MPRTKVSKKTAKRSRGGINEKLQEFEGIVDAYFAPMESENIEAQDSISDMILSIKNKLPASVLKLKMSELREMGINNFSNIKNSPLLQSSNNSTGGTSVGPKQVTKKISGSDDGYLTREENNRTSMKSVNSYKGPLALSQLNKRRSRSVTNTYTPQPTQLLVPNRAGPKRMTPMTGLLMPRESRSKFRTPIFCGRPKACSVDRVITPKVQPNTPLALLRHARTGESVFSLSGSPVITASVSENVANVNIPIGDGVLSIRPTEMGSIDPNYVKKIPAQTIAELKQLQANLDHLMKLAHLNQE